eukprot:11227169-Lingulodinium_polyedra.AAC.2
MLDQDCGWHCKDFPEGHEHMVGHMGEANPNQLQADLLHKSPLEEESLAPLLDLGFLAAERLLPEFPGRADGGQGAVHHQGIRTEQQHQQAWQPLCVPQQGGPSGVQHSKGQFEDQGCPTILLSNQRV